MAPTWASNNAAAGAPHSQRVAGPFAAHHHHTAITLIFLCKDRYLLLNLSFLPEKIKQLQKLHIKESSCYLVGSNN